MQSKQIASTDQENISDPQKLIPAEQDRFPRERLYSIESKKEMKDPITSIRPPLKSTGCNKEKTTPAATSILHRSRSS